MISLPPPVSPHWTGVERLSVIAWISRLTLDRIARDDPAVPLLAKDQVRELFRAIQFIAVQAAMVLEEHREILLKPYNDQRDHYGVEIPQAILDKLKARKEGDDG